MDEAALELLAEKAAEKASEKGAEKALEKLMPGVEAVAEKVAAAASSWTNRLNRLNRRISNYLYFACLKRCSNCPINFINTGFWDSQSFDW